MENPADPESAWRLSSQCPHCSKMLGRKDALERHICTMHKEHVPLDRFKYKCDLCPQTDLKGSFVHKQSYDEHMTAHCGRFKCKTCGRTYKNKKGLVAHEVIHTEKNKLYQCDLCPTGFASLVSFNIHLRTQHPESATIANDRFLCELCSGIYSTRRKLELHVANSHQAKSLGDADLGPSKSKSKAFKKCSLCSANFESQSKLLSHRMSVHNKKRGRPRQHQWIQSESTNNVAIIDADTTDSDQPSSAEEEEEDSNNGLENVVKSEPDPDPVPDPDPEADPFIVPESDSEMIQNVERLSGEDEVEETVDLLNTEDEMTVHDYDKSLQNIELICEVCSQCFSDRMALKSHRYRKHLVYEIYC